MALFVLLNLFFYAFLYLHFWDFNIAWRIGTFTIYFLQMGFQFAVLVKNPGIATLEIVEFEEGISEKQAQ